MKNSRYITALIGVLLLSGAFSPNACAFDEGQPSLEGLMESTTDIYTLIIDSVSGDDCYAGSYMDNDTLCIAATDTAKAEKLYEEAARKYGTASMPKIRIVQARYTYKELSEVRDRLSRLTGYGIQVVYTDPVTNSVVVEVSTSENNELIRKEAGIGNVVINTVGDTVTDIPAASRKSGWRKNKKGKRFYYENGEKVTGVRLIGNVLASFDEEGVCIYRRNIPSASKPYVLMDDHTIQREQDTVGFEADFSPLINKGVSPATIHPTNEISLSVYKKGKWYKIPLVSDVRDIAAVLPLVPENGITSASLCLSDYKYGFPAGIYRLRYGYKIENADDKTRYICCEFNVI